MTVTATKTDYIITLPKKAFSDSELNAILNDLRLKEVISKLEGSEDEANELAEEIMQSWWLAKKN
jgi:ABC-type uncharacterized transport system fused permease/ATPase subunit